MKMRTARLLAISAACAAITAAPADKEMPMSDLGHGASVTWRVLPMTWMDEDSFGKLVELFSTNRITGKIALFTCPYHVPATFEEMEKECALLKQRMPVLKQMGYEVGINHLCTVGHVNEDLEHGVKLEGVQHFTGIDGSVAPGNYCLRDEAWRAKYVRPVYKMLAQTGPDFIWTDDDRRLGYQRRRHGLCQGAWRAFSGRARERPGSTLSPSRCRVPRRSPRSKTPERKRSR